MEPNVIDIDTDSGFLLFISFFQIVDHCLNDDISKYYWQVVSIVTVIIFQF